MQAAVLLDGFGERKHGNDAFTRIRQILRHIARIVPAAVRQNGFTLVLAEAVAAAGAVFAWNIAAAALAQIEI